MTRKFSFYIAGKWQIGGNSKLVHKLLNLGHEVTYDWTFSKLEKPYLQHREASCEEAVKMRQGAADADIFILFWHDRLLGALVELGIALGHSLWWPKHIFIVQSGRNIRESVFFALPEVKIVPYRQLEEELEQLTAGG